MMHAVRVCHEADVYLLNHVVTYPVRRPLVLKVRKGELRYAEVAEVLEAGMTRLEEAT
jgi:hypothetical protein